MKKTILRTITIALAGALLLTSCSNLNSGNDEKAYISINSPKIVCSDESPALASASRSVSFISDTANLKNITLTGTREGGTEEELIPEQADWTAFSEVNTITIQTGTWDFTLNADYNDITFSGSLENQEITTGTNSLSFNLEPTIEWGGLSIKINFTSGTIDSVERIDVVLADSYDALATGEPVSYPAAELMQIPDTVPLQKSFTYKRNITSEETGIAGGTYWIQFRFYGSGITEPLNTVSHIVKIANGFTATWEQSISLNEIYGIVYNLYASGEHNNINNGISALVEPDTVVPFNFSRHSAVTLPNLVMEDKTFSGWFTDETYTNRITEIPVGTTKNLELYGQFIPVGQGNIIIDDSQLEITADIGQFYLNTGKAEFHVKSIATGEDMTFNEKVTWSAELRYGQNEINSFAAADKPYYATKAPNKEKETGFALEIVNPLEKSASYQLYVSAKYQNVISSATFNISTVNSSYLEYNLDDLSDHDLSSTSITDDLASINSHVTVKISGSTDRYIYQRINSSLANANSYVNLDLSELDFAMEDEGMQDTLATLAESSLYSNTIYSIKLPECITEIAENAFYESGANSRLSIIEIPATVATIDENAFYGCNELSQIIIDENNGSYASAQYNSILIEKVDNNGTEIQTIIFAAPYAGILRNLDFSTDELAGVTAIAANAFKGCESVETITSFGNITTLGGRAFADCTSLTSISSFGNITAIPQYAFKGCSALESIDLSGVEVIYSQAFAGTDELTSVEIPASLYAIGNQAFISGDTNANQSRTDFSITLEDDDCRWYYISGSETLADTAAAEAWNNWISEEPTVDDMPSSVSYFSKGKTGGFDYTNFALYLTDTAANGYYFYRTDYADEPVPLTYTLNGDVVEESELSTALSALTAEATLTVSGEGYAHVSGSDGSDPAHGTIAYINATLANTTQNVNLDLSGLVTGDKEITWDDKEETIIPSEVISALNIKSIVFPNVITTLGCNTFGNYYNESPALTTVTIPANVTNVERKALNVVSSLTTINVNENNTKYKALNNSSMLVEITSSGENETYKVINCAPASASLTELNFSSTELSKITEFGDSAFEDSCVQKVTSFGNIEKISQMAFQNCKLLSEINLENVEVLDTYAFINCSSLANVTLASSVYAISYQPFVRCANDFTLTLTEENNWYKVDNLTNFYNYISSTPTTDTLGSSNLITDSGSTSSVTQEIQTLLTNSDNTSIYLYRLH